MTLTYTSPIACNNVGTVVTSINTGNSTTRVLPENLNCFTNAGLPCTIQSVPYGLHTIEVTPNCPNNNVSITVNGQNQSGTNGLYTFTVTTDSITPNITVNITCF